MAEGRIIKALSGFYYVQSDNTTYQCKGRGVFRKNKITPLVGDFVTFDLDENDEGYIKDIKPRTSELVRPPIANIDQAIIVSSAKKPNFSTTLLDRFLVLIEAKDIDPIIVITKIDLLADEEVDKLKQYQKDYEEIGYTVKLVSNKRGPELELIKPLFKDKVSVIAGQSGVGKSSLLNALNPSLLLETGAISKSLGRGKHTTRHVELIEVNEGLVADTPGFSALEFDEIELEHLPLCFPEMRARINDCKFRGCMHIKEPKCAVKAAVESGDITSYRYEHYVNFVEEIQSRKPRY
ncbi:ribosome small subunit-dependent GTPase A [Ornithinibacillus halophilus]|uniref:Small ribosomal subunit biogenesis GTPase RsgA n=1 Tax=Ornithinibacillus halophilus TaxID=930117 RepID=A0A1M5C6Y9_9BACI|nr:ribosome small subunit-dependent GTPase A [Ornithinibacillus halophilus]SHF50430.1 ribosome biogenesis GTPase [Ornithinibacillus halophilus]